MIKEAVAFFVVKLFSTLLVKLFSERNFQDYAEAPFISLSPYTLAFTNLSPPTSLPPAPPPFLHLVGVCARTDVWKLQGELDVVHSVFLPCVLGTELRPLGLAAGAYTY